MRDNDAVVRFKEELFGELGITENPKRELLFSKAWELGHHAGFGEVESYARDLVELIVADEDLLKAVFVIDALKMENAELRECLKEACHKACEECTWKHFDSDDCRGENHEDCECKKWRTALEGGNRANA